MLIPGSLAPLAQARAGWLVSVLVGLAAAIVVMALGLPDRWTASVAVAWAAGLLAAVVAGLAGYAILAATLVFAMVGIRAYLLGPDAVFEGLLAFGIVALLALAAHGGLVGVVAARSVRLGRRAVADGRVLAGSAIALGTGGLLWWAMAELALNPA